MTFWGIVWLLFYLDHLKTFLKSFKPSITLITNPVVTPKNVLESLLKCRLKVYIH
jgi:hypothetical protein